MRRRESEAGHRWWAAARRGDGESAAGTSSRGGRLWRDVQNACDIRDAMTDLVVDRDTDRSREAADIGEALREWQHIRGVPIRMREEHARGLAQLTLGEEAADHAAIVQWRGEAAERCCVVGSGVIQRARGHVGCDEARKMLQHAGGQLASFTHCSELVCLLQGERPWPHDEVEERQQKRDKEEWVNFTRLERRHAGRRGRHSGRHGGDVCSASTGRHRLVMTAVGLRCLGWGGGGGSSPSSGVAIFLQSTTTIS